MKTTKPKTFKPFPCGAVRPPSPKNPKYADAKAIFEHYRVCQHPGCKERLEVTKQLGRDIASCIKVKKVEAR